MGSQVQAVTLEFRAHQRTALRIERAGVYDDQSPSLLQKLISQVSLRHGTGAAKARFVLLRPEEAFLDKTPAITRGLPLLIRNLH